MPLSITTTSSYNSSSLFNGLTKFYEYIFCHSFFILFSQRSVSPTSGNSRIKYNPVRRFVARYFARTQAKYASLVDSLYASSFIYIPENCCSKLYHLLERIEEAYLLCAFSKLRLISSSCETVGKSNLTNEIESLRFPFGNLKLLKQLPIPIGINRNGRRALRAIRTRICR